MILLDCGNSQIKGQCWRGRNRGETYFHVYDDQWQSALRNWLTEQGASRCYFASVLDRERQAQLDQVLAQCFADAATRLSTQAEALGVTNGYAQPQQLGVDRWLALLAAAELVAGDCIVIDAGSAITVDLLRGDGRHLGGAILPGCNTSREAFERIFSHIDFSAPEIAELEEPGHSTAAAIQIDYTRSSLEALVDLVNRWVGRLDGEPTILLAGGDAYTVQRALKQTTRIVPDLVFRGMRRMANA